MAGNGGPASGEHCAGAWPTVVTVGIEASGRLQPLVFVVDGEKYENHPCGCERVLILGGAGSHSNIRRRDGGEMRTKEWGGPPTGRAVSLHDAQQRGVING